MATNTGSLANKYRPHKLGDVLGQATAVTQLRGMLSRNKPLPPVSLFEGPSGTGKTTLARITALYFNCEALKDGEPCGTCGSCQSLRRMLHDGTDSPDVSEMNAAMYGGIDMIRKLNDVASMSPRYKYRIFILDEAHQITSSAFGSALKLFENAPPRTKFFLVTTNPEKLPKAILGRCENKFSLHTLGVMDVAKRLYHVLRLEGIKVPDDFAKKVCTEISASSGGDMRDALGALDNLINFIQGNGGIEGVPEATLQRAILQASHGAPYVVVQRYVAALFSGDYTAALSAVKEAVNQEYFARKVLESLHQVLYMWVSKDHLVDNDKLWMLKGVNAPDFQLGRRLLTTTSDVDTVLNEFALAVERIKTYVSDPVTVLQVATLRVMRIMATWGTTRNA